MPHDARAIANFFIESAWQERCTITHLSLQKILFFAHAWHLGKFGEPLVGQKFEAWKYGPVVRVVYDQLRDGKSKPIDRLLRKIEVNTGAWVEAKVDLSTVETEFLSGMFQYYSRFHAGLLVDLTHAPDGPWEKIWKKAVDNAVAGMIIPDNEIKNWILRGGGREESSTH